MSVGGTQNVQGAQGGGQLSDNMDLETMFMMLALDRSNTMDKVISDMAADMKTTNERINKLNNAMSQIRAARPDVKADKDGEVEITPELRAAMNDAAKEGVALPDSLEEKDGKLKGKPAAFDAYIENIKTKIDSLSSNSQLDMIKLQGMINKRNQVIEMASNIIQKFAKSMDNLIANMR